MHELQRITFRFSGHTEVRYLSRLPQVGDRVSHDHDLWAVTSVEPDPVGAVVTCELPRSEVEERFAEAG